MASAGPPKAPRKSRERTGRLLCCPNTALAQASAIAATARSGCRRRLRAWRPTSLRCLSESASHRRIASCSGSWSTLTAGDYGAPPDNWRFPSGRREPPTLGPCLVPTGTSSRGRGWTSVRRPKLTRGGPGLRKYSLNWVRSMTSCAMGSRSWPTSCGRTRCSSRQLRASPCFISLGRGGEMTRPSDASRTGTRSSPRSMTWLRTGDSGQTVGAASCFERHAWRRDERIRCRRPTGRRSGRRQTSSEGWRDPTWSSQHGLACARARRRRGRVATT